jgi:hypothetical protein
MHDWRWWWVMVVMMAWVVAVVVGDGGDDGMGGGIGGWRIRDDRNSGGSKHDENDGDNDHG